VDGPRSTHKPFIVLYAWPKLPMYRFSYHHSKIVSNTLFCAKLQFIVKAPAAYKMSAANRGPCGLPASLTADTPAPAVPRRQPPSLGPEFAGSRELGRRSQSDSRLAPELGCHPSASPPLSWPLAHRRACRALAARTRDIGRSR